MKTIVQRVYDSESYSLGLRWEVRPLGITVLDVLRDSPAYAAGIQVGDVIFSASRERGQRIEEWFRAPDPGTKQTFTVPHAGQQRDVVLVPEPLTEIVRERGDGQSPPQILEARRD